MGNVLDVWKLSSGKGWHLKMVDLCSGLGGASQTMVDNGWEVVRFDNNPLLKDVPHTRLHDIMKMPKFEADDVDLIWASPPCVEFSLAIPYPACLEDITDTQCYNDCGQAPCTYTHYYGRDCDWVSAYEGCPPAPTGVCCYPGGNDNWGGCEEGITESYCSNNYNYTNTAEWTQGGTCSGNCVGACCDYLRGDGEQCIGQGVSEEWCRNNVLDQYYYTFYVGYGCGPSTCN